MGYVRLYWEFRDFGNDADRRESIPFEWLFMEVWL